MTELLRGDTALVTGAGRGIGRGIATELARHGCDVAVNDIDEETAASTADDLADAFDARTLAVPGDVTDSADAALMVRDAVDAFGGLDVLVNNAAIINPESYEEIDAASWDQVLDVNLGGVQKCTAAAYDELKGGGRIVNVASTAGLRVSLLAGAHYTSSKWGVIGLTKHVAHEGGAVGIRANAVCPGATETERIVEMTDPEDRAESAREEFPLGRWGTPEDVGKATVFLASDLSAFVTGVALPVDGGFTIL